MKRKKDSRWIFLSLFYPAGSWPFLLQKAVIPFLKQQGHGFRNYILHFGKDRGEHIGLSFEVPANRYEQFVLQTDLYFREFLRQFPAQPNKDQEAAHQETKYMDFTANTVCHSLHHFLPSIEGDNGRYTNVWRSSSDHLLKIYQEVSFDKEDLFTATLYLNLLLLLWYGKNNGPYPATLSAGPDMGAVDEGYVEQFAEQETLFMEIRQDCLHIIDGIISEELEPVAAWFGVFNDYLQASQAPAEIQSQVLKETISWLRAQLGMVSDGRSFIDFCLHRLLPKQLTI